MPILPSTFLTKTLEKETLKITCFRDTFRPRQVCRYDRVSVVREVHRIRAAKLPILPSTFLTKTLEKETLKITCFRDTFRPRQVCRYDRVSVVREVERQN